jgi:hypothetical protein
MTIFLVTVVFLALTILALRIARAASNGAPRRANASLPWRKNPARGSHPHEPNRPLGPDDNPDFIRELARRRDSGTTSP